MIAPLKKRSRANAYADRTDTTTTRAAPDNDTMGEHDPDRESSAARKDSSYATSLPVGLKVKTSVVGFREVATILREQERDWQSPAGQPAVDSRFCCASFTHFFWPATAGPSYRQCEGTPSTVPRLVE